jgi:hypothetical protein
MRDRYLDIIVNRQTNFTVRLAWQHDLDISSTKDDLCDISHNVTNRLKRGSQVIGLKNTV